MVLFVIIFQDLQARKAKKPAYNKLTHLDTVVKGLAKVCR